MWNSMMMMTLSVCDWKYLFGEIWSNKSKLVSLSWNFTLDQFEYAILCRKCMVFTFSVLNQKILLGKSGQQNQNCQFKLKIGTKTNLNMSNSTMMMFTFSVFDHKYPFWAKIQNCLLKVAFLRKTNSTMQNSIVGFISSV